MDLIIGLFCLILLFIGAWVLLWRAEKKARKELDKALMKYPSYSGPGLPHHRPKLKHTTTKRPMPIKTVVAAPAREVVRERDSSGDFVAGMALGTILDHSLHHDSPSFHDDTPSFSGGGGESGGAGASGSWDAPSDSGSSSSDSGSSGSGE